MLKKYINKFMNKKSDFTYDDKLRSLNDQFYYLMGEERKLLNHIIKENVKYYFTYKKVYLTKLLTYNLIRLSMVAGIIYGVIFSLNYFNIMNISKAKPKVSDKITIYLPDYDTINQVKLSKTFNVVIFFPPDPKKDWKLFKQAVHNIETRGTSLEQSYLTRSGDYWGRYQMGPFARKSVKLEKVTWEQFSKNPDLQEAAFYDWCKFLKIYMLPEINKYNGKFINGVQMTESGIIMIAHNSGGAKSHLQSGNIPDGVIKFAKLGGYNLNLD